jgi:hypothetical protein
VRNDSTISTIWMGNEWLSTVSPEQTPRSTIC